MQQEYNGKRVGQCTGANSTLNKGATGLPLRASAAVGHEEGRGRERERERDSILYIERVTMHREKKKGKTFW